jgi:succinate dehydrogenase / fumarate reductase cytochrome b subunit
LFSPWLLTFYAIGLICASWHFAYGIWLFCAKWGLIPGEKAQRSFLKVCVAFFLVMSAVGVASLYTFRASYPQQPTDPAGARVLEMGPQATQ